jgi:hypothetical protein
MSGLLEDTQLARWLLPSGRGNRRVGSDVDSGEESSEMPGDRARGFDVIAVEETVTVFVSREVGWAVRP